MNVLLRFITKNVAGSVETTDRRIDAPVITIGRATDQILQLRDRRARLQHARLEEKDGKLSISTSVAAGLTVNGRSVREASLVPGDVIEVGANILRVLDAPADADFALSFELSPDADREQLAASWAAGTKGLGGFTKRKLSWLAVVIVVVSTFALPALVFLGPDTASLVRDSGFLPDDDLWLAGPLHAAHAAAGTDCQNCHAKPFIRVQDDSCLACHTVSRHVMAGQPGQAGAMSGGLPVIGSVRCASCHVEHEETAELVNSNQQLCGDCHSEPPVSDEFGVAGDFLDRHRGFRVQLLVPDTQPDGKLDWHAERLSLADTQTAERSNLNFDHFAHLDPEGIVTPDGRRVLECSNCHTPEPGGARMQPITMDKHCSTCHTLGFDPDAPSRVVPHGDPPAVVQTLIEYYSARLLGDEPDVTGQRLRRPGKPLTRAQRDRAAAEARDKAMTVAADLFERRACSTCHVVTQSDEHPQLPWKVLPVRLASEYLPDALFSHAQHGTDVAGCGDCHNAAKSESADDVLIPDINVCRDCHGSGLAQRNKPAQVQSTCILCHNFHSADKGTVGDGRKL
ncbi:MAG TPA: cytochrome c3 family protein [Woeseiaceae bacterium]|nr:cytochrome c3 family protein [Woeseiaceae bacterium]